MPVLVSLSGAGSAVAIGPSSIGCAQAASMQHAALVVAHGDGAVTSVCVPFSGASITGAQLLSLSRVEYATTSFGATGQAVCQLDGEPAQYPPTCWTASSPYWAMYVSRGGGPWTFSNLGVSTQTFQAGDAEGFRYESQSGGSPPPSPRGVCPAATPPPQTPPPTATPAARSTSPTAAPPSLRPIATSAAAAAPAKGGAATVTAAPAATVATSPPPSAAVAQTTAHASPRRAAAAAALVARGAPPAPPSSIGGGTWAAALLAMVLVALAGARVVGERRRRSHGTQP